MGVIGLQTYKVRQSLSVDVCLLCTAHTHTHIVLFATDNGVRQLSVDNAGFQFYVRKYVRNVSTSAVVSGTFLFFLSSVVANTSKVFYAL